jgi:PST family polysaccharide transporter
MLLLMTVTKYIFPIITLPYLTRVLQPDMYGTVVYLTSIVSFFQVIVDFGFNLSATREIAKHSSKKHYVELVLGATIQAKILILSVVLLIYTFILLNVPIMKENILLSFLFIGTVVLSVWLPDFLFRGIERMEIITIRFILSKSISTILIFVFVKSSDDVMWVPILNILGSLTAVLLSWFQIIKTFKYKLKFCKLRIALRKIKESFVYFTSTVATTAFGALTTFMLGIMELPTTDIAYWGLSISLISSAQSLYSPITNSLYPHMVSKKDLKLVRLILLILVPIIFITIIIVGVFSELVIKIFAGDDYIEAKLFFQILLPVLLFSFPAQILGFPVLGAYGMVKETTTTTVITAIFHSLGLIMLALIGQFNILNVAILRSTTEAVLMGSRVLLILYMRKKGQIFN